MPEGPSIVILKEAAEQFANHKVIAVTGNAKIDKQIFVNKKVLAIKTYGKHFLICFKDYHPKLPTDLITNTNTAYIRLHGNPHMFYSNYETDMLKDLHKKIKKNKHLHEAFVYFNNTASTAGITNAQEFKAMNK